MCAAVPLPKARNWPTNPYKGLNFYSAEDAPLFSLRDEELDICEQLLGSNTTKLLLLHGRTGTGKSSFLRAGLYAHALRYNHNFYLVTEDGEPCFIRSTSNPIASVSDSLLGKLNDKQHFPKVPDAERHEAQQLLSSARAEKPAEQARALRAALSALTAKLVGTLVLVIDQAEEVFTLDSQAGVEIRDAYFQFLDDLCFQQFDIKLIITLRTEFYGQFVDKFRVPPNLTISPVASGLDQFMLHGIQDPERLRAAIELPTLEVSNTPGYGSPRSDYHFIYEPGLAVQIAQDLTEHCGESSALPVMQIVCSELFASLPKQADSNNPVLREVKLTDYTTRGGVTGAIDRYIEKVISGALKKCNTRISPRRIDGWKHIVSALVARQEGGALTSMLTRIDELQEKGREAHVLMPVDRCLQTLASDEFRLLRCVKIRDPQTRQLVEHYSLAHDALATSLLHWKETRGKEIEDRARIRDQGNRRLTWSALSAAVIFLSVCLFAGYLAISAHSFALRNTLSAIEAEPLVTSRLLRLAALESNSAGIWRGINGAEMDKVVESLRSTLLASPVFMASGRSANIAKSGDRIVIVSDSGEVSSIAFQEGQPVETLVYEVAPENVLGSGFIDGLPTPVIVTRDERVYAGKGEPQLLSTIVGDTSDLDQFRIPWGDSLGQSRLIPTFTAGKLEIGFATARSPVFYLLHYDASGGTLASSERMVGSPLSFAVPSPYTWTELTVYDEALTATAGRPIEVVLSQRGDQNTHEKLEITAPPTSDNKLLRSSIAFLPDGEGFALRDTIERVTFGKPGRAKLEPTLLEGRRIRGNGNVIKWLEPLPVPGGFGGPALAAVRTPTGDRIAWLSSAGVTLMQSNRHGDFEVPEGRPEFSGLRSSAWSVAPTESLQWLRFDVEGGLLTLILQGKRTEVRVWNISDLRAAHIRKMSTTELIEAACNLVVHSDERVSGTQLSDSEFESLPVSRRKQPCPL